jgi:hypothetical protein
MEQIIRLYIRKLEEGIIVIDGAEAKRYEVLIELYMDKMKDRLEGKYYDN